jgi:glycerophosphoryl diester phosphodiesterase
MKKILLIVGMALSLTVLSSCSKDSGSGALPDNWFDKDSTGTVTDKTPTPAKCDNIVVAHRGGSTEAGTTANPDNSLAALRYAMALKCYASECDIYCTSDNQVIVAHGDAECKVNGLHPWEATLAQIRAVGNLANGEQIPTLGDMLDVVMTSGSCTKLWLDIKNITSPSTLTKYPIEACKKACEIITAKKAKNFVEFICTGNYTVMASSFLYATSAGVPVGWMSNSAASVYVGKGYSWANLSIDYMTKGGGERTIDEFTKAKVALSIFVVDSDDDMTYYANNASKLKAITTNYPKKLLVKMGLR